MSDPELSLTRDVAVPSLDEIPQPESIDLPDGRRLAWYELGDPSGVPAIFSPGTPVSGISGAMYHLQAQAAGVRWLSMDKPGYGHSDELPGRALLDWANDISNFAQHIGLGSFASVGESGGGPHALAIAFGLGKQVTTTILIGGTSAARGGKEFDDKLKETNRALFTMAREDVAGLTEVFRQWRDKSMHHEGALALLEGIHSEQLARDRAVLSVPGVLDIHAASLTDAFRDGVTGAVRENQMFEEPWGFSIAEITGEVHLWHGSEDVNVPISVAESIAKELRHPIEHFVEGAGHWVGQEYIKEIMGEIVAAATR